MMKDKIWGLLIIVFLGLMMGIGYESKNDLLAVYLDNTRSGEIPSKRSNYIIDKIVCDNDVKASWDNINWSLSINNLSQKTKCNLYFKSKKDITITYDNNYVKNNIFEEFYNTGSFGVNGSNLSIKHEISDYNGLKLHRYVAAPYSYPGGNGIYLYVYKQLTNGSNYYYSFEARLLNSASVNVYAGSEQYGENYFLINSGWKKFEYQFTAKYRDDYMAFVFYNWPNNNILEVRNLSLQEGEYDNYSKVTLKEYDSLGNLSSPGRDGYTFLGWYTEPIEGEKISDSTLVTEDTTYYAHWQYNG